MQELADLSNEESLADTLDKDLRRRYGPEDLRRIHDLLGALAWAEGRGFPRYDIWPTVATALSDRTYGDDDVRAVLATAGWYVKESGEDGQTVYRLYHQTFADHFRGEALGHEVQAKITAALRALAERRPDGWLSANPYLLRHLAAHAAAAQADAESGPLDQLLTDSGFLVAADIDHLARAVPRATSDKARAVGRAYLRATHLLRAATPAERASLLTLMAAQEEPGASSVVIPLPDSPWQASWTAWRPTPFHLQLTGHKGGVRAVAFGRLPDGRLLLASAGDDATVRLWDPVTGHLQATFTGHGSWVRAVAFGRLPDDRLLLASAGDDATVRLWDPVTGRPRAILTGHQGGLRAVAFGRLPDGRVLLASASADTPCAYGIQSAVGGGDILTLTGHRGWVRAVAFGQLSDGRVVLVSAGDDRMVRLWHPATGQLLGIIPIGAPCTSLAAWDGVVAVGANRGLVVLDLLLPTQERT